MKKYIAFLRAINVGGTTIIKMTDLRRMFETFGLEKVETFIQTGNVIFDSQENKPAVLEEKIEHQLAKASGKQIRLFVRTTRELAAMVKDCPFDPQEGETVHVVILVSKPGHKNLASLCRSPAATRARARPRDAKGAAMPRRAFPDRSVLSTPLGMTRPAQNHRGSPEIPRRRPRSITRFDRAPRARPGIHGIGVQQARDAHKPGPRPVRANTKPDV